MDFNHNLPFDVEHYLYAFVDVWSHPGIILAGPAVLAHLADHSAGARVRPLSGVPLLRRGCQPALLPAGAHSDGNVRRLHPHPLGDLFQARAVRYRRGRAAGRLRVPASRAGHRGGVLQDDSRYRSSERHPFRNARAAVASAKIDFPGRAGGRHLPASRWRAPPGSGSWRPR